MNSIVEIVSRNVAIARKRARMKQSELAQALGVSAQSVSEWERGNTYPNPKHLEEMAELLGLPGKGLWFYQPHQDSGPAPIVRQDSGGLSPEEIQKIRKWLSDNGSGGDAVTSVWATEILLGLEQPA